MTANKTKEPTPVDRLAAAIQGWVRRQLTPLTEAQADLATRVADLERQVAQQRVELLRLRADPER